MDAIQINRLRNMTDNAVCIDETGKWFPLSQIDFVYDPATKNTFMMFPAWLTKKNFSSQKEFDQFVGILDFDPAGMESFEIWTLDVQQDVFNYFHNNYKGPAKN